MFLCSLPLRGDPSRVGTHTPRRDPQHLCPPSRRVWIEKESINSVAISDSPEDLHQRVLVAASLSVNATGECGCTPSLPPPRPPPSPSSFRLPVLGLVQACGQAAP